MMIVSTRLGLVLTCAALVATVSCARAARPQSFASPEEAVAALSKAAQQETIDELLKLFGPDVNALVQSSSPVEARQNREVFVVAMAEGWHLEDEAGRKVLVVGNEKWPFPIPLVQDGGRWQFDIAAGADEVLARRIGRNELAVIELCRKYVAAQQLYAASGHDGRPAGRYATVLRSDPGRHNGLYWPAPPGDKASPLGALVAEAAQHEPDPSRPGPLPFHGYHFAILTAQGDNAPGGGRDYVAGGEMTGGFALVAWPAEFGVTGIMTFVVAQDGTVYQKSLGDQTFVLARALKRYDPDPSWTMTN